MVYTNIGSGIRGFTWVSSVYLQRVLVFEVPKFFDREKFNFGRERDEGEG